MHEDDVHLSREPREGVDHRILPALTTLDDLEPGRRGDPVGKARGYGDHDFIHLRARQKRVHGEVQHGSAVTQIEELLGPVGTGPLPSSAGHDDGRYAHMTRWVSRPPAMSVSRDAVVSSTRARRAASMSLGA